VGHAYTPGLKVTDHLVITKKRILPLKGEVLVKVGGAVGPDTVVARTHLPGPVEPVNVANILGLAPSDVPAHMLKKAGEAVKAGEAIATATSFFGLFKSECKAKVTGTIENISSITGQVLLRGEPMPVEVKAYLPGEVVEVFSKEGVAIQVAGAFVQGIFGISGETHGELKIVVPDRKAVLTDTLIDSSCNGSLPMKWAWFSSSSSADTLRSTNRPISLRINSIARSTLAGLTPALTDHGPGPGPPPSEL